MAREEAYNRIDAIIAKHEIDDENVTIANSMDYDALRIARKLLEQEPCEDAISCEAVIEWLKAKDIIKLSSQEEMAREELKALPFGKPQPKMGHWIELPEIKTSTPEYFMFYECSECGDKQCFCKSDIHKKHFCNNCGAKMAEPHESEGV